MGWVQWVGRNWVSDLNEKGKNKNSKNGKLKLRHIVIRFFAWKMLLRIKEHKGEVSLARIP